MVCGLLLWHFDLIDVKGLPGLWRYMGLTPGQVLRCHASLREKGRLAKCVYRDEDKATFDEERTTIDPNLAEVALEGEGEASPFAMHRESQVTSRIGSLGVALAKKADAANDVLRGWGHPTRFRAAAHRCRRMLGALDEALRRNPGWELARLQAEIRATPAWEMFIALLARESGEAMRDDDLGTGRWLALAAAREPEQWRSEVRYLRSTSSLRRLGLVEPCGGPEDLVTDDLQELERVSFGLGPRAFERLGLERRRVAIAESRLIQPRLRLADLVLSAETGVALDLAVAQAAHAEVLLDRWGLGRTIAYGRGVTLLFSGPPGTGKTAAAEALAGELGAPLLVADYSRIQQALVGQTEKNIVRAFQEARRNKAVLFWDEADAMFHDRETARYAWEVRDVNVLLQEVERFDGVCVLATNRTSALDKALARRIAVKVEFPRPDRPARRRLWRKLIPAALPLAGDVDLDEVAAVDLSGGEIKNAVLNAAGWPWFAGPRRRSRRRIFDVRLAWRLG